jgi:ribonuclease G
MNEEFLINFTPQETRVALLQQGTVQELHVERIGGRGIVGNIYLGKVVRVLPGMQSAFVEIGLERTAFLHVADIFGEKNGDRGNTRPIERLIAEGETLMVQALKDPIGTKGARLSTQISLAGRLLVYLPQEHHIGISQKIEDEAGREALRERIQKLLPADEAGGFIVRTMAENATDEELAADIAYLRRLWQEIRHRRQNLSAPIMLHHDLTLAQRVLRDLTGPETTRIVADSRENFQRLSAFAQEYMPQLAPLLSHYTGERPLFDLYAVEDEIQKALARRVDLKSGGYLIIDQTEAMTTIDVNTGAFVGARNFDDTIFKTNLEAAQTIARQLRLRNLGGMESPDHRDAVLAELNKALARDHTRISVNGFTQLGLVEMTRKRTRESLAQVLCEPCPTCGGRGIVKTARTVAYEILRELLREARQFAAKEMRVLASPAVIDLFHDEESQAVAMLSDFVGRPISLQAEPSYTQEQYDIVLM